LEQPVPMVDIVLPFLPPKGHYILHPLSRHVHTHHISEHVTYILKVCRLDASRKFRTELSQNNNGFDFSHQDTCTCAVSQR